MKMYRLAAASSPRYPVVRLTYTDGFTGDYDMSDVIGRGPMVEALSDPDLFAAVVVDSPSGSRFGWKLEDEGNEIDFGAHTARIKLETDQVRALAARFRARRTAAE